MEKSPKLCKRGLETAKVRFKIFPSAFANAHAVQVCKGKISDLKGHRKADPAFMKRLKKSPKKTGLSIWFKERWVNVCERDSKGRFKPCGRPKSTVRSKDFPFCRPTVRINKQTPKTVKEMTPRELKRRCKLKRSVRQGVKGKATFVRVS